MSLESAAAHPPASLPIQFVDLRLTPLANGHVSIRVQATRLDEDDLEFVGEDLADEQVRSLTDLLRVIQQNVAQLSLCPA
jgi:hypothetical protein